jgi:hypothetical protein
MQVLAGTLEVSDEASPLALAIIVIADAKQV